MDVLPKHTNITGREFYLNGRNAEAFLNTEEKTMYAKKTVLAMTAVALMCLTGLHSTVYAGEKAADYTDVVILSTTDMHGKCWNTNVLTDSPQRGSMLKVSSAVTQIREEYGEENVLLVDNGDLFQGTPAMTEQTRNMLLVRMLLRRI